MPSLRGPSPLTDRWAAADAPRSGPDALREWKTLARRVLLDCGKFLTVESHTVQLPDGQTIPDWTWVVTPDYVNIVAVTDCDLVVCFRQTKYAVQGSSLATVGGYIEPGEDPLTAAQRELREETGYEAPEWRSLGSYAVDGNRGAGRAFLFLARGARRTSVPQSDDLEQQKLMLMDRSDVARALVAGEFRVLPWAAAMALALLSLESPSMARRQLGPSQCGQPQ